jgi:hypothetical protein
MEEIVGNEDAVTRLVKIAEDGNMPHLIFAVRLFMFGSLLFDAFSQGPDVYNHIRAIIQNAKIRTNYFSGYGCYGRDRLARERRQVLCV